MPERNAGPSFTYVFEALKVRWTSAGLALHIPGGITRDHAFERTARPYVIARLVTEYIKQQTNRGRYDHVDFELTACADTPEAATTALSRIIEALRVPLEMSQDARMVRLWLADVKAAQEEQMGRAAQGFSCIVARTRFAP